MKDLIKSESLLLDRLTLQSDVEMNLLNFINLQINKLNNENSFKLDVLTELKTRMDDGLLSDIVLLKLLEILSKQDNELSIAIMDIVKNNKNNQPNAPVVPEAGIESERSSLSKDDVKEVKDLLKAVEQIKKSEF